MPYQLTRSKKRLTSSTTRDYSGTSRWKGPKVLKLSQMQEEKWQLDDRRKRQNTDFRTLVYSVGVIVSFLAAGEGVTGTREPVECSRQYYVDERVREKRVGLGVARVGCRRGWDGTEKNGLSLL
ncbi:hypothetical protein BGY98DRAFT_1177843 [Russula aff. rugulosa BPL654]|nr:hypothetical protein BGY98DRAFT_1177843 [Russula aff. rugulosa BPL654]